jgi:hypothetical protein
VGPSKDPRRFLFPMPFPAFKIADDFLVSNDAGRCRAVAAQGRAFIALYGRRAILMRHETSRNAAGQQARGKSQTDDTLHGSSLAAIRGNLRLRAFRPSRGS